MRRGRGEGRVGEEGRGAKGGGKRRGRRRGRTGEGEWIGMDGSG